MNIQVGAPSLVWSSLIFPIRLLLISQYFATSGSVCLFLNRRVFYFCSIMKEHVLEWFKTIIRRRVDLRRLTAICGGDRILARRVAVRGLKELAEDIEKEKD